MTDGVVTVILQQQQIFLEVFMNSIRNFLIGLAIALAMVISSCEAVSGPGDFANGDAALSASRVNVVGININSPAQLMLIGVNPALPANGSYDLTTSLTLPANWRPICGPAATGPFTGSFNGHGYTLTVTGFDLSTATDGNLGIFATSDAGASFTDLKVNVAAGIVSTTNVQYVGGLVGQATGTNFDGITVTGTLDLAATSASEDTAFNVGLVAGSAAAGSGFGHITIDASLNVLYNSTVSDTETNRVYAGGIAGALTDSKLAASAVDGAFTVEADMPYYADYSVTPSVDNWVALGAAVGYAENAGLSTITVDASTTVDATSVQTPVFVGGVVGRGQSTDVYGVASDAVVTGSGIQYNSSSGGVAGYIIASRVAESSASGVVTVTGPWDGSAYNLWQVYAGGLVGYAGGTSTAGSLIDHSHATGAVSATSPYPYAGGAVGYLYGFNDFSSPEAAARYYRYHDTKGVTVTYRGGRIIRSYATGSVTAAATPGTGGLPYAGGLAGYSSIPTATENPDPNIENCYATGSVTATSDGQYAWAGGLVGANAQGSIVATSYATGAVSVKTGVKPLPYGQPGINPGAAGGGIVGVNYYTDATSGDDPLVTRTVALNPIILGSSQDTSLSPYLLHRVAGDLGDPAQGFGLGILDDNYASSAMVITPVWNSDIGPDELDGASVAAQPDETLYTGLGWNFSSIWVMGTNYPVLR
jgi:hypothetical protein